MKVLLVNGSPHENGCTYTGLSIVAKELENEGIETEIFHIGVKPISGCVSCGACAKLGKCAIDDVVNEFLEKADSVDGFIFGSPVYFASMNGSLSAFMDRAFYSGRKGGRFRLKPAASIVNARRGGNTATFDQINKYFTINEMPIISSNYWNQTHGVKPEHVLQDEEGVNTLKTLGRNMAYFLKCMEVAKNSGVKEPEPTAKVRTNFIR